MSSNIKLYFIISFLNSCWFQLGNWAMFVLLYISNFELGLFEFIAFGIGFVFEIPTGAIADLLGKKKTIVLGNLFLFLGTLIFTLGFMDKILFLIGNIFIIGLAFPLISGSFEALAYDTLLENGEEEKYSSIAQNITRTNIIALFICPIIGGILWKYSVFLPWALTTFSFFWGFVLSLFLVEPKVDSEKFNFNNFIKQNKIGFHMFSRGLLKIYIPIFMVLYGIYYMWSTGMVRVIMGSDFGFNGENINYLIGICYLFSALLIGKTKYVREKLKDRGGILMLIMMMAIGYLLAFFARDLLSGVIVFLFMMASGSIAKPWISVIINENTPSKYRATTISTFSFLIQFPYILIVLFFGKFADMGITRNFYLGVGILLIILLIYALIKLFINSEPKQERLEERTQVRV
ncbi:MFS transporter [Candidatus Dojkabacteria bacterium]|nr:MFS transporter [Candidatus Dojkabacteria bacterium]